MSITQIAEEALRLPPQERARLAQLLWESLTSDNAPGERTEEDATRLAVERDRQLETGEVQPLNHSELMARLRR